MSLHGSVSHLVAKLKAGNDAAAQALWDRFCDRLVRLAKRRLRPVPRRVLDEEDIALSAFNSLCIGARSGRFPRLENRESLWGLLAFITAQKAADRIAHERRRKRGSGQVRGGSALARNATGSCEGTFDQILAANPGPATLNLWAEEYERLLNHLGDETLRKVALWSVEGCTTDEIADKLGCARRTVARKLQLIRKIWHDKESP
jgi:DNA-directed RNA polymerase specialized sigma24 family protein